jgi:hypothetical protein
MWHAIAAWWAGVAPNLESNVVWGAPAFAAHHLLMRRHNTDLVRAETAKQTRQLQDHLDQRLGSSK